MITTKPKVSAFELAPGYGSGQTTDLSLPGSSANAPAYQAAFDASNYNTFSPSQYSGGYGGDAAAALAAQPSITPDQAPTIIQQGSNMPMIIVSVLGLLILFGMKKTRR